MNDCKMLELLQQSIHKLGIWLEKNNYRAYDLFDGLNSFLYPLTFKKKVLRQMLIQTVKRSPTNLRPLLRIKKAVSSKGMGYLAKGYLRLYCATNEQRYFDKLEYCLNWLKQNYNKNYSGYCWGNHFDYQTRGYFLAKGEPTIVWTSLIAHSFLDAYEALNNNEYLEIAKSACDFILHDLGKNEINETICIDYIPYYHVLVHNSNMLGASLLARVFRHSGDKKLLDLAQKAVAYTMQYQSKEGAWYYGEELKFRWVDNFHSGYVLESLKQYIECTGDETYMGSMRKGYEYYKNTFFLENGIPRYYDRKTYPIDIQCASQSIETLLFFRDLGPTAVDLAKRVVLWTIENMQDKTGYFYFQKHRWTTNKTPMLHWGQATMLSALAGLLFVLSEGKPISA